MPEEATSICSIMNDNTSKMIKKLESQIPINFQIYSDIYREYFHMLDDLFGACYRGERNGLDKMLPDPSKEIMVHYTKYFTDLLSSQIENYSKFLNWYSQIRISGIKNYEVFAHSMIDTYEEMMRTFTSHFEKYETN